MAKKRRGLLAYDDKAWRAQAEGPTLGAVVVPVTDIYLKIGRGHHKELAEIGAQIKAGNPSGRNKFPCLESCERLEDGRYKVFITGHGEHIIEPSHIQTYPFRGNTTRSEHSGGTVANAALNWMKICGANDFRAQIHVVTGEGQTTPFHDDFGSIARHYHTLTGFQYSTDAHIPARYALHIGVEDGNDTVILGTPPPESEEVIRSVDRIADKVEVVITSTPLPTETCDNQVLLPNSPFFDNSKGIDSLGDSVAYTLNANSVEIVNAQGPMFQKASAAVACSVWHYLSTRANPAASPLGFVGGITIRPHPMNANEGGVIRFYEGPDISSVWAVGDQKGLGFDHLSSQFPISVRCLGSNECFFPGYDEKNPRSNPLKAGRGEGVVGADLATKWFAHHPLVDRLEDPTAHPQIMTRLGICMAGVMEACPISNISSLRTRSVRLLGKRAVEQVYKVIDPQLKIVDKTPLEVWQLQRANGRIMPASD